MEMYRPESGGKARREAAGGGGRVRSGVQGAHSVHEAGGDLPCGGGGDGRGAEGLFNKKMFSA